MQRSTHRFAPRSSGGNYGRGANNGSGRGHPPHSSNYEHGYHYGPPDSRPFHFGAGAGGGYQYRQQHHQSNFNSSHNQSQSNNNIIYKNQQTQSMIQSQSSQKPRGNRGGRGLNQRGFVNHKSLRESEMLEDLKLDNIEFSAIQALDIDPQIMSELRQPGKACAYLNQFNSVCVNQIHQEIKYDYRAHCSGFICVVTLDYPEHKVFTCKAGNKKESKNAAALVAIHYLREANAIDSKLKFQFTNPNISNQFSNQTKGPIPISPISIKIKQQMMSFSNKFDECMDNLIEHQIEEARKYYGNLEIVESEGKHLTIDEGVDLDEEMLEQKTASQNTISKGTVFDIFSSRPYASADAQKRLDCLNQLRRVYQARDIKAEQSSKFREICQRQKQLPIRQSRQQIINAISSNRVIVVAGETGSGKSTQLPQFLMEEFLATPAFCPLGYCNIAITQPRRISAISLAERVATELGESGAGQTVGHQVRFDARQPNRDLNAMMFFTTGMLLRKLHKNPNLDGITHLVIDEVHERDCTTDFLLILIKRILERCSDIRVVLMSASMDAQLFSQYFNSCPVIHVSGRCFPVTNYYMEDLCKLMGVNMTSQGRALRVNNDLVVDVILYIDDTRDAKGAILCFLPGWSEIKAIQRELEVSLGKQTRNKLKIFTVHSKLPVSEQRLIFSKSQPGERKVILATNIAETSITIDDVAYVIDSGLCNSIDYDQNLNMSNFGTRWISRANAKQRSGRAGRTCPGDCFKLYTRTDEQEFREFPHPELLRIPLESVIMEVKSHCPSEKAVTFLSEAIQHPSVGAINSALEELISLRVLDQNEYLTVLGKRILGFTTHPRLSVSLVLATALRCLYPVLNVSAMLSSTQEPFRTAVAERQDLRQIKMKFCHEALKRDKKFSTPSQISDHIALALMLCNYDSASQSRCELNYFIEENILSRNAMANIAECRNLYAKLLVGAKFVNTFEWYSTDSQPNVSMDDFNIFTGALIQAFYPKIIRIIRGTVKNNMIYPSKVQAIDTKTNQRIRMATDSVLKQVAAGKDGTSGGGAGSNSVNANSSGFCAVQGSSGVGGGFRQPGSVGKNSGSNSVGTCESDDDDSDYLSLVGGGAGGVLGACRPHFVTYLNSHLDQESNVIVVRDGTVVEPNSLIIFGGSNLQISEAKQANGQVTPNTVILTLDRNSLLSFRLDLDDARALSNWRSIWQRYFDWFVHTKNSTRPPSDNDAIINKTMNEFLDITRQLLSSTNQSSSSSSSTSAF